MTTIRFTENQVTECGYDFSELPNGEKFTCTVCRDTYWTNDGDQVITELTIERLK